MRLLVMLLISITLMTLDHRFDYFNKLRSTLEDLTAPVQYLVNWPIEMTQWIDSGLATQQQLLETNAHLRAQQIVLQARLQTLLALKQENAQLQALLNSSVKINNKVLAAHVLAVATDAFSQRIILNKGKENGVTVGQPVLDAYGIMGQVIFVSDTTSRVLLVTDRRSAVPVIDSNNGIRAIAVGTGNKNNLRLIHIPITSSIRVGDVLMSSGLGQRFPSGYPLGVVQQVTHVRGDTFANVIVKPSAHVNRSQLVLIVSPSKSDETA